MKKGDYIIIGSVIALALVLFFVFFGGVGKKVVIKQDNAVVYEGSLSADKTVSLKNNTVIIKDGKAFMQNSTCKNKICIHTGKIEKKGESIICLPNKVSVTIK